MRFFNSSNMLVGYFFFFSSRRRHTRLQGDWSSDVCAADRATVDRVHEALLRSRDWGLAHLDELATAAHRATGVSTPECRDYFAGLDYAFTDRHLAGLGTLFRKLAAHGLAPAASLRYLEVA